jgi:predicted enzyme related to lactoylglutathione lyase
LGILAWFAAALVAFAALAWSEPAVVRIEYLEIVTPEVDETIATLEKLHGVKFSDPVPDLGNARTAPLAGGSRIAVRAPMHEAEHPVVRPYILLEKIDAAIAAAEESGGQIAHPPLEIPGQGTFAIYFQGGNQYGLWKN